MGDWPSKRWENRKEEAKPETLDECGIKKLKQQEERRRYAERERRRQLRECADSFWSEEERKMWAERARHLTNKTIRDVLHMALAYDGPRSMRKMLCLAPTLTADALIVDAVMVNSKVSRPTRRQGRLMHDISIRQRFLLAPTDNLVRLRQLEKGLADGTIRATDARKAKRHELPTH